MDRIQQPPTTAARDRLALDLALEHPALGTDPVILCAAAQTCKAWQLAVQQCRACNTVVVLDPRVPLQHICSFRRWLRKYAALVKSLTVDAQTGTPYGQTNLQWQCHLEAVQALLQQAIELAAAKPAAATSAAAAAPLHESCQVVAGQKQWQMQQQQQRLLRLASFSSNLPGAPSMLTALPAHNLTQLDLTLQRISRADDECWLEASLPQLKSLQQLRLVGWHWPPEISGGCLAGIAQLTRLTSLEICEYGAFHGIQQPLQQVLATPLPLRILRINLYADRTVSDLSALTQLEDLTAALLPGETVLPPQLQHLEVTNWLDIEHNVLAAVLPLQQLRTLSLQVEFNEQQPLLRIAQLPALQRLELAYCRAEPALGTAAAWPQLPQLQSLEVWWEEDDWWSTGTGGFPDEQQLAVIWDSALACTGLTKLALSAEMDNDGVHAVSVCARLARLTCLKNLLLFCGTSLVPGDAQALTALTGLTRLSVGNVLGIEEADIVVLAHSMPHLQHLSLDGFEMSSNSWLACMAAVGRLTQLTELCLENSGGMTDECLLQLTGLVHLQEFERGVDVTDEAVDRLWARLRMQRKLLQL